MMVCYIVICHQTSRSKPFHPNLMNDTIIDIIVTASLTIPPREKTITSYISQQGEAQIRLAKRIFRGTSDQYAKVLTTDATNASRLTGPFHVKTKTTHQKQPCYHHRAPAIPNPFPFLVLHHERISKNIHGKTEASAYSIKHEELDTEQS